MDIPYVVVQWWSSVIAAKQKAPGYLRALAAAGYPDDSEQYNSLPLGELLAADDDPPWGGLPRPAIISASLGTDAMRQLFETWAERVGRRLLPGREDRGPPRRPTRRLVGAAAGVLGQLPAGASGSTCSPTS